MKLVKRTKGFERFDSLIFPRVFGFTKLFGLTKLFPWVNTVKPRLHVLTLLDQQMLYINVRTCSRGFMVTPAD